MMTAIYPGSFDPITLGHIDIIERAARCFDRLYVCVMMNADKKNPMFTPEERMEFVKKAVARFENVQAESWQGLLRTMPCRRAPRCWSRVRAMCAILTMNIRCP